MGSAYEKRKRAKQKKLDVGRFFAIPHKVLFSEEYRKLKYSSKALLFDIAAQFSGKNNGKLVCCESYLRPLGWNSNGTITSALKELLACGLLIQTRQGMRPPLSQAAWFALGWLQLDKIDGLDINPTTYRRSKLTPIATAKNNFPTPKIGMD